MILKLFSSTFTQPAMIAKTPDYIITEYGCPQWISENKSNEDFVTLFKGYEIINDSNRRLLPLRETLTDYYARTLANRLEALKETKKIHIKQGKKQTQRLNFDPVKVKELKMQRNEAIKMQRQEQHQQQQATEQEQHHQEYEQQQRQHQYGYQLPQKQQQPRYSTDNRSNIFDQSRHKRGTGTTITSRTTTSSTTTAMATPTIKIITTTTTPTTLDNDLDVF